MSKKSLDKNSGNFVDDEEINIRIDKRSQSEEDLKRNTSQIQVAGFYPEKHSKEYEIAETKLKEQEFRLKEAETKFKEAETKLKEQEVEFKRYQVLEKFRESELKFQETKLKEQETKLKEQEAMLKKQEANMKELETVRYDQETKHHKLINESIDTGLRLKNLETRFKMIYSIGLNFSSKTDFETLMKMSSLLGDDIPEDVINDLKSLKGKIKRDLDIKNGMTS